MDALKAEIAGSISTQLSNVYVPVPRNPSLYASAACSALGGTGSAPVLPVPTKDRTVIMSETLDCTIDTSNVDESKQKEVQPGTIRVAIGKEIHTSEGHNNWRCTAVMRDPRNSACIQVACRDEDELRVVKQAAEKAR
jgi:hypothetical protein